jgi:hypothetical protein
MGEGRKLIAMSDPARQTPQSRPRPQSRAARLRAAGLRPVRLWLPDTSDPAVIAKMKAEARALAEKDRDHDEAMDWVEAVFEWPKE